MSDINLEKIDIIRERTGVSYAEAKKALEFCEGNVVDTLIYIEENMESKESKIYSTLDEFMQWLKDLINKGNISRIKIRKEDKVLVDVPVNAGIAAGVIAAIWPPLIAIGLATAVLTKVTIEITKDDGSVEIINKVIKSKTGDFTGDIKEKINDITSTVRNKFSKEKEVEINDEPVYKYTVKFEDMDNNEEK